MIVEMESSKYIEVLLHCEKNEKKKNEGSLHGWSLHFSYGVTNSALERKKRKVERDSHGLKW